MGTRLGNGREMITEAELGWMAGILDFQGHVVRKNNNMRAKGSVQVTVYVETSITEIIERLGNMTGTSPEPMENKFAPKSEWNRKGCSEHCPEPHVHSVASFPDQARWTVSGAAAAVVLWNVRDHLVTIKDPSWDWAMAMCFASTRLTGQGSGQAMKAVRRLATMGWELPPVMAEAVRDSEVRSISGKPSDRGGEDHQQDAG